MRAVTGRYQKQKHIFRHSFKVSAIYQIIALAANLASTLNLVSVLPSNLHLILVWKCAEIFWRMNNFQFCSWTQHILRNFHVFGLEGVGIFSVLIERVGRERVSEDDLLGGGGIYPHICLSTSQDKADRPYYLLPFLCKLINKLSEQGLFWHICPLILIVLGFLLKGEA